MGRKITATGKRLLSALGKRILSCLCCDGWPPADPCPVTTPPCVETTYPCNTVCPTGKTPSQFRFAVSGVDFDCDPPLNHNMSCDPSPPDPRTGDPWVRCPDGGDPSCTSTHAITGSFSGVFTLAAISACAYRYKETNQSTVTVTWTRCPGDSEDVSSEFDLYVDFDLSTLVFEVYLLANPGGAYACCASNRGRTQIFRANVFLAECETESTTETNCGVIDSIIVSNCCTTSFTCCFTLGAGGYHHGKCGSVTGESCP